MKKSFRYVIVSILASLLLVFGWQVYWLHGLYVSMEEEVKKELTKYVESADHLELFSRIDIIEKKKEKKNFEKSITISAKQDEEGKLALQREEKLIDLNKTENNITTSTTGLSSEEELSLYEHLVKSINQAMHDEIDKLEPIDLHFVDSLIRDNLIKNNAGVEYYYIDIWDTEKDSAVNTTLNETAESKAGKSPTLSYFYGKDERFYYRVYMEPLTKTVLIRMGGILVTSLLIILILAFAFWYLIRTVLNQKTLEEMKDDFTNNMTHELKTPIAVAYSATDALLNFDLSKDDEKRQKYLQICKEQLSRLSQLVEQILSMSMEQRKSFALQSEEFDIKEMVNELIEEHKLKTEKPVAFSISCPAHNPFIYADRTHLYNMLSNLIDNAIKYSETDSMVSIEVTLKNGQYHISVTDNGPGIPADKQAYIFDKFYRVPRGNLHNVKGYGLGLFYVKVMAEKHGGSVSVKSTPGKGATFMIHIPANNERV